MKNSEKLKIAEMLENEKECVMRASKNKCNRDCGKCDLLRDDREIINAYNFAIKCVLSEYVYCINNENS